MNFLRRDTALSHREAVKNPYAVKCHHRPETGPKSPEKMRPRTTKETIIRFWIHKRSDGQRGRARGNYPVYVLFDRLSSRAFGLFSIDTPFYLVRVL